jgi:hypothetical protein
MSGKIGTKSLKILYTLPIVLLLIVLLSSAVWAEEPQEEPGGAGEQTSAGETTAAAVAGRYDDGRTGNWASTAPQVISPRLRLPNAPA